MVVRSRINCKESKAEKKKRKKNVALPSVTDPSPKIN